jgi:hypothetical protein
VAYFFLVTLTLLVTAKLTIVVAISSEVGEPANDQWITKAYVELLT